MTHWDEPGRLPHAGTASPGPALSSVWRPPRNGGRRPARPVRHGVQPDRDQRGAGLSFQSTPTTNRFFIELVNTLTAGAGTPTARGWARGTNNASVLDLAGFQSTRAADQPTPWDGGCWDLVFTDDNPLSRPDPVTGPVATGGNYYGLIPLVSGRVQRLTPCLPVPRPADPVLFRCRRHRPAGDARRTFVGYFTGRPPRQPGSALLPDHRQPPAAEHGDVTPLRPDLHARHSRATRSAAGTADRPRSLGVLPPARPWQAGPRHIPAVHPAALRHRIAPRAGNRRSIFWVCLRRPANPFAPVSATNPMIVVDAMRFPFIEAGGTAGSSPARTTIFSYQRLQPFRGGHAVPMPGVTGAVDPRYGYSEQIAVPTTLARPWAVSGGQPIRPTPFTTLWAAQRRHR